MARNKQQERTFFFIIFALLALLTFIVIRPFLGAILLALITVVLLRPLYVWLSKRKPRGIGPLRITFGPRLTTTLTILFFLLLLIVPLVLISIAVFDQVAIWPN